MMNSAKMRHRIDIQKRTEVRDADTGSVSYTWEDLWQKVPAEIEFLSVRDFIQSKANQVEVSARIKIRFVDNLPNTIRIVDYNTSKIYNPIGAGLPDNETGRTWITFACSQGVNSGE